MFGSDVTKGLFLKRSSLSVSGTTITSGCWIATEQKAMSRGVSDGFIPIFDLNHWRFSSISEIIAIGVLQMKDASSVRSSKACSGSVSRMAYFWRAATRSPSFLDIALCASMEPPENSRRGETDPSPQTTWMILLESLEEKNDGHSSLIRRFSKNGQEFPKAGSFQTSDCGSPCQRYDFARLSRIERGDPGITTCTDSVG